MTRTLEAWRGYEREFLIELVRALDEAAFALTVAPNHAELARNDSGRHLILMGAATALRPLITLLHSDPGGVPWGPTSPGLTDWADQHLLNCGRLAMVLRLAAMERYGLASSTFLDEGHLVLEAAADDEEVAEKKRHFWLSAITKQRYSDTYGRLTARKDEIAKTIDQYANMNGGWFIEYDPSEDAIAYHRDLAFIDGIGTAEAETLPDNVMIGERLFGDWKAACTIAYGTVLHHIACATRLKAREPSLTLRNLLTIFARKDDIAALWRQRGETDEHVLRLISGITFDVTAAEACVRDYEIPLPYYIDFGRDFLLLPVFGGLMNHIAGLTWHLRRTYRRDWDSAVNEREAAFRKDLRAHFGEPRYSIPDRGYRLRKPNGQDLTDIDAAILDRETGSLALVQLKWPEIYGRSLAERNSRRLNLLAANQWVERVFQWIEGRTAGEVAKALNIGSAGKQAPALIVLARHTGNFVGDFRPDPRAHWMSWPRLVEICQRRAGTDILGSLRRPHQSRRGRLSAKGTKTVHRLPGLTVEIRVV